MNAFLSIANLRRTRKNATYVVMNTPDVVTNTFGVAPFSVENALSLLVNK
ncbi:hypothetical protein BACPLE_02317 [Phocaeicola plebeius DSM 17135]|uniref:Uncharacterized protein n=1 Tax=Phocaeicola plebeius (strain DSM 17135 / JCM 12973 / CCUG 54634 / M2) TaxID=484018 RepID=B5CZZ6_PHOPM|nr:hypothetical protein BACPLE_02317 [Phocaeicola plebeius DSM 17135]